uniref:RxLR effector candidate protein n=1 Tax=Peronospora matthiolae TaxID=2874970 RepID=A0AAV1TBM4_9STRA
MRVCYFALLHTAALVVMATKSSETFQPSVHLGPLRDVDDHRNNVSVNRALRAQAAPDDEVRAGSSSAITYAMQALEVHAKLRKEGQPFGGKHFNNLMKGLSQRGLVNGVVSKFGADKSAEQALVTKLVDVYGNYVIGQWIVTTCLAKDLSSGQERMREILVKHWVATPALRYMIASIRATNDFQGAAEQALVKKLVDAYGDKVIGPWTVRLSLAKNLSSGQEFMLEILAKHWVAKQDPLAMITWLRTTKNFQDTDFYLPVVAKLLQNVKPTAVNEAIFAACGESYAYFVTVLYRASMKKESDLTACKEAWRFHHGHIPEELLNWSTFLHSYHHYLEKDFKKFKGEHNRPYDPLNLEQLKHAFVMMSFST